MSEKKSNVLDKNRIIYLNGDFNEEKAEKIITRIFFLESEDPT